MTATVLSSHEGRVGYVTLNRPDAYNAITTELAQSLQRPLAEGLALELRMVLEHLAEDGAAEAGIERFTKGARR